MSEGRDELLESLRQDWRELDPRAPDVGLERPDELTAASVEWMRSAWEQLEAPSDAALARRRATASRRSFAAALAAAAAIAALLWLARADTDAPGDDEALAEAPPPYERVEPPEPAPMVASIRPRLRADGSVELRSGKVRLILCATPPSAPPNEVTDDREVATDVNPSQND